MVSNLSPCPNIRFRRILRIMTLHRLSKNLLSITRKRTVFPLQLKLWFCPVTVLGTTLPTVTVFGPTLRNVTSSTYHGIITFKYLELNFFIIIISCFHRENLEGFFVRNFEKIRNKVVFIKTKLFYISPWKFITNNTQKDFLCL